MMSNAEIEGEVRGLMEQDLADGKPVRAVWLVQSVVNSHPLPEFDEARFYRTCAYGHVRGVARRVVRSLRPNEEDILDPQRVLPGFSFVQRAYLIDRSGEQLAVPTEQMTMHEIGDKVAWLRTMAHSALAHADELERYGLEKFSGASTAARA